MTAKRFTVTLERVGKTATMFRIPFDLEVEFGRKRPPVLVTIRDYTWRTTPGIYHRVGHIVVNRNAKSATKADAGDRVRVTMEVDTKPRTVNVPRDLAAAFETSQTAKTAFDRLSFTHKREYVEWIEEAKRPETRARRIASRLSRVRNGETAR